MTKFENYIDNVLKNSQLFKREKAELKEQFIDHINSLKEDYISKGIGEIEAINLAIHDFGNEKQMSELLSSEYNLKSIIKVVIITVLILYSCVVFGHYIKMNSSMYVRSRFYFPYSIIPFEFIISLLKNYLGQVLT